MGHPLSATIPVWFQAVSGIAIVVILLADLVLVVRRPHIPAPRESSLWVGFYVALALVFAALLFLVADPTTSGEFLTGWLTEYSLSIDNLFVFVLLMTRYAVPQKFQQEVLMVGILIALLLRGIVIIFGAALIVNFSWIFYLFGAWLLWTAYSQAFRGGHDKSDDDSRLIGFLRRKIGVSDSYDGMRLRTTVDGVRVFTPLVLVFIALGVTDLIFALDSIPAIFGITQSPFIVFAANVFALMGLRQLYFLLGHLVQSLIYLKYGIAVILGFIGVKLIFHAMHENQLPFINGGHPIDWVPTISTPVSLLVIVGALLVSILASLGASRVRHTAAPTSSITETSEEDPT